MKNSILKPFIALAIFLLATTTFIASQEPSKQTPTKTESKFIPHSPERLRIKSVEVLKEEAPGYKRVKLTLCPWYGKISTQGLAEKKPFEVHDQQVVMIVESEKLPRKDDIITLTISSHLELSSGSSLVPCSCTLK
jgi:hypothetical protein